ncbi:MAG: thioredoxin family protein [Edaphobacter sp.]|uniref:thioredoxin family protein n=1 Tax=Edaphobacter sp. TaxID=1934404 RepID=UPI00239FB5D9|nr:thioredoxin family protein [Edaphobacter sp.]MDE1177206.1 thioredoxin family protein [Edaphobacter sp.]
MFKSFLRRFAVAALFTGLLAGVTAQAQMTVPFVKKNIYSDTANARMDISAAVKKAKAERKRVILDFGGNWCGDCQVLDYYMQDNVNAQLLAKHFVVVHVDIGRFDRNVDVAKQYKVPIEKGVPALAVLDSNGALLYSQANKEFENMRNMRSSDVTEFLNHWKSKS